MFCVSTELQLRETPSLSFAEISCALAVCRLVCQLKHQKLDVNDEEGSMKFAAPLA